MLPKFSEVLRPVRSLLKREVTRDKGGDYMIQGCNQGGVRKHAPPGKFWKVQSLGWLLRPNFR